MNPPPSKEEEDLKALLQVEQFILLMEKRTGLTFTEVVEILQWTKKRMEFTEKIAYFIIGALVVGLIGAVLNILWRGFKIGVWQF